jgi:hypothetical protein
MDTLIAYFQNIFPTHNSLSTNAADGSPQQTHAGQDAMPFTHSVLILQELHTIVKNMRSNASPGPDGLNAAFYKHAWPWIPMMSTL